MRIKYDFTFMPFISNFNAHDNVKIKRNVKAYISYSTTHFRELNNYTYCTENITLKVNTK